MKKNFSYLLWMVMAASVAFAACSDDDEEAEAESGVVTEFNELSYLQYSLVELDSTGNFKQRILGEQLDADTTIISVGVEDMEEARGIFDGLFAPTTQLATDGNTYTLADNAGYVTLKENAEPENGVLAYVSFDKVPGLKYVTRLNFIQNEAWPNNAPARSPHKLGLQYEKYVYDWLETFVCIREYKNGVKGILAGISKDAWRGGGSDVDYCPHESAALEISKILRKDWKTYKTYFNANGKDLLQDGRDYWINETWGLFLSLRDYTIYLDSGKIEWWMGLKGYYKQRLFVEYFGGVY